jgi:hypothetical protein
MGHLNDISEVNRGEKKVTEIRSMELEKYGKQMESNSVPPQANHYHSLQNIPLHRFPHLDVPEL